MANPNNPNNPHNYPAWAKDTSYSAGLKVHDPPNGGCWECCNDHISGDGTMAQDRAENPGHWRSTP